MERTETRQVKVLIEADGLRYEASGAAEEIIPQVLSFLSKSIPTYDLARKLAYIPDLSGITDKVAEFARITNSGQLLLTRSTLPADEAIMILLFMGHLASKLGKRQHESVGIEDLAVGVGKAQKTIRNVIGELLKRGLITRAERGAYQITPKGLMNLENSMLTSQNGSGGATG